jgi:hypothetical protein
MEPNTLHPLNTLVDAGLVPKCRAKAVQRRQQRIQDGINIDHHDVLHKKDVYMSPAPSIVTYRARELIDKRVKLHWHMCHSSNAVYTTFRRVKQFGHHCDMFVKTTRSVPSDAIYESHYVSSKLVGWNLVWTRSNVINWDSYMHV